MRTRISWLHGNNHMMLSCKSAIDWVCHVTLHAHMRNVIWRNRTLKIQFHQWTQLMVTVTWLCLTVILCASASPKRSAFSLQSCSTSAVSWVTSLRTRLYQFLWTRYKKKSRISTQDTMVGAGTCAVVCQACHSNKCHKVTQWERFFSVHNCLDVYQLCAEDQIVCADLQLG